MALRLWTGSLPATTALATISDWWQTAAVSCGFTTLQYLIRDPSCCVIRRSGRLLVTVHPEVRGDGAKTEAVTVQWMPISVKCFHCVRLTSWTSVSTLSRHGGVPIECVIVLATQNDSANWAKTKAASLCLANGVDLVALLTSSPRQQASRGYRKPCRKGLPATAGVHCWNLQTNQMW